VTRPWARPRARPAPQRCRVRHRTADQLV
jgi:hypothetical protein